MRKAMRCMLGAMIVALAVLGGCATVQPTGYKAYAIAQEEFTTLQAQYIAAFKAADKQTQDVWRQKITPKFLEADKVLDDWAFLLTIGDPTADTQVNYQRVRRLLLNAILEVNYGN